MWSVKRTIMVGLFGLLALVVVAGGVAFAQAGGTPTPTPQTQGQRGGLREFFLNQLASNLGVSRSQLDGALKNAAHATVDEGARQGRFTPEQANRLHERINQGNFGLFAAPGGHHRRGGALGGAVLNAIAAQLQMDAATLREQLRSGTSLADIARARGVTDLNTLKPAIIAAIQNQLRQQGVSEERIKQITDRLQRADLNRFGQFPRRPH